MKKTDFKILYTAEGENLPEIPLNFYPRPALARDSFLCLNGTWDFSTKKATPSVYTHLVIGIYGYVF